MKDRLTPREQKCRDIIAESGVTPIPPEDIYYAASGKCGGIDGRGVVGNWIERIRKKRPGSIINIRGFGYVTEENQQKRLERIKCL
ncbi:MAG: hypothetical protein NTV24_02735 [Candidatus Woesebacteria bacterium]|nr:hypothetical protein [Candidatus Woesebacteria bacterium]